MVVLGKKHKEQHTQNTRRTASSSRQTQQADLHGEARGVAQDGIRSHQGAAAHVRAVDLQASDPGPHAGRLHQPPAVTGVHGGAAARQRWNQGQSGVGQRRQKWKRSTNIVMLTK